MALARDDHGADPVPDLGIGQRYDAGLGHRRVAPQRVLDLVGRDEDAAALEAVVLAPGDPVIAVPVAPGEIAGVVPAVMHDPRRHLLVAVIAEEKSGAVGGDQEPADLAGRQDPVVLVRHRHPRARDRTADRARPHRVTRPLPQHHLHLGDAVMLPDVAAHTAFELLPGRGLQSLAGRAATAQGREVVAVLDPLDGEDAAIDGRDRIEQRDLEPFDRRQHALGPGRAFEDRARHAVPEREDDVVTQRADEAPLAGRERHVAWLRRNPMAVRLAERHDPAMGVNDPLGPAGGPRCVDHEGRLVGTGIGGRHRIASCPVEAHRPRMLSPPQERPHPVPVREDGTGDIRQRHRRIRSAVVEHIVDLLRTEQRVDQHRDRADPREREEGDSELDAVGHPHQDLRAASHAGVGERPGEAGDPAAQAGIARLSRLPGESDPPAMLRRLAFEDFGRDVDAFGDHAVSRPRRRASSRNTARDNRPCACRGRP